MIHLHTHSEYSALDGLSSIEELVKRAKELGMSHLGLTDHGNMNGFYELNKQAKEHGIKPLYGCEFYTSKEDKASANDCSYHLICYAKNQNGLKSLYKLHRLSYDNFYKKPQVRLNDLMKYGNDLVVMSACIGGMIPQAIVKEDKEEAIRIAKLFADRWGEDFYLEIQPTDTQDQMVVNRELIHIGAKLDIQIIATNDIHYTFKEDAEIHDILLAMQFNQKLYVEDKETKEMIPNPKKYSFVDDKFYMRDKNEMLQAFEQLDKTTIISAIDAIDKTKEIAKKCEGVELITGDFRPRYNKLPEGKSAKEHLADLTRSRIREKYPQLTKQIANDVAHELDVIETEDYSDYFLIVQDALDEARRMKVLVGDGRGSGAGSKVAYINDITKVDPVKYNLLFERFLDYNRQPDIDSDLSDQEAMFQYLQRQHGFDNVTRIITFGTMGTKSCVRKTLSAFAEDQETINLIAKLTGNNNTFSEALEASQELFEYFSEHLLEKRVIERLEGRVASEGSHAGGVVIYPNIANIAPVKLIQNHDKTKRNIPCVCYDKYPVEDVGFVKFDMLGLKTLSVLDDAITMIEEYEGTRVDIHDVDLNDQNILDMLAQGRTYGVFQLSDQGARLAGQEPKNFNDIVVFTSIIRPGVGDYQKYLDRRFGREKYELEPERESYMRLSEGLIIFQEQYEQLANTYAGWSFGFADTHIRKNKIGLKKDIELEMKFVADSTKHSNISEERAEEIWTEIVEVAGSGLNSVRLKLL